MNYFNVISFLIIHIGVADKVFARIGASDNIIKHMSTFYTEMIDTAHILIGATPFSFVLLDEIGKGLIFHNIPLIRVSRYVPLISLILRL